MKDKNGFIKIVNEETHCCDMPEIDEHKINIGSIWQCPICRRRWKIDRITHTQKIHSKKGDTYIYGGTYWELQENKNYLWRLFEAIFDL